MVSLLPRPVLRQSNCTVAQGHGICFENKILHEVQYYFTSMLTEEKNVEMFSFGLYTKAVAQQREELSNPVF